MQTVKSRMGLAILGVLGLMPALASAYLPCQEFRKEISIDGGATWYDANDAQSAPTQTVGGGAEYRFVLKNCSPVRPLANATINDPDLGISAQVGDGVLDPLEQVVVSKGDAGFAALNQPMRCATAGLKVNTATLTSVAPTTNPPTDLSSSDPANLLCEEDPAVAVGDRVWEDLDADGAQDCVDGGAGDPALPADGIIGNAGDSGPECGSGVPDVTVSLFQGADCSIPAGPSVTTDSDGFYLFEDLAPGDYCVQFDPTTAPADLCTVEIDGQSVNLGAATFTAANAADFDVDSDADPTTGLTGSVNVPAGANLSLDAGLVCPAKVGDLVFQDDDRDGIQDLTESGVPGVTVSLVDCGPDNTPGTADDVATGETRITDGSGRYMFGGEPGFSLNPGNYFVVFDSATYPAGFAETLAKQGGDDRLDSDCLPPGGGTACVDVSASRAVNLHRDCGLVPPPPPTCDLVLDKTCRVEPPPTQDFDKCDGRLQQFSVAWTGGPITVNGGGQSNLAVNAGDVVTFTGPFASNDVVIELTGSQTGTSTFHTSCSDDDFNSPDDCGKAAGNGKGSSGINLWTLAGFVDDSGQVLNCASGSDLPFAQRCSFEAGPLPSCDTTGKPDTLTWRYDGGGSASGGCDGSSFATAVNADGKPHSDFVCDGAVDASAPVTVLDDDGGATLVNPGESFTIDLDASKELTLVQAGGAIEQRLEFHTSCSQPLAVGLTGGALTLAAMDGDSGGAAVTYQYQVTNGGDPLGPVSVVDDLLGDIGSVASLGRGETATFLASTQLSDTTVNVATATGTLADGSMCSPASATDQVTVEAVAPTCRVTAVVKEIKDDKVKFTVTNASAIDATLVALVLNFPAGFEAIKKVKLDGDIYKADDSSLVVGPGVTIGGADWTESQVSKRVLEPGESRTLEIEFTRKFKGAQTGDFSGVLNFVEGCSVGL